MPIPCQLDAQTTLFTPQSLTPLCLYARGHLTMRHTSHPTSKVPVAFHGTTLFKSPSLIETQDNHFTVSSDKNKIRL